MQQNLTCLRSRLIAVNYGELRLTNEGESGYRKWRGSRWKLPIRRLIYRLAANFRVDTEDRGREAPQHYIRV